MRRFLVWGDPSLYDSTLRIIDQIVARGVVAFDYEVIPGISAVQALAARHRIALNRIGRPVEITTGRKLTEGLPSTADDVVVMLDADCSFKTVSEPGVDIYWGAYLGTDDEILLAGKTPRGLQATSNACAPKRKPAKAGSWTLISYARTKRPGDRGMNLQLAIATTDYDHFRDFRLGLVRPKASTTLG